MGWWSAAGEGVEAGHLVEGEIVARIGSAVATARTAHWGGNLGHMMSLLLGVEHHLLISPLCELSVCSGIIVGILRW